jgi:hypothetical protein
MSTTDPADPATQLTASDAVRLRRLHRSTIAICVALWLVSVPLLWRGDRMDMHNYTTAGDGQIWEHGWPWTFLVRRVDGMLSRPWWIYDGEHEWFPWALAFDAGVLVAVGLIGALGWEFAVRRRASLLQFRLRSLIVAVTFSGIGLGWWTNESRKDREELIREKAIATTGNFCEIDYIGPLLLRRLFGASNVPGHRITHIAMFHFPSEDEPLAANLPSLDFVREVHLYTKHKAQLLTKLKSLPEVDASNADANDATVKHLASVRGLRRLNLFGTAITDASLRSLANCETLEVLNVSYTAVTDAGLRNLPKYKRLRELDVSGTAISDSGIRILIHCPSLEKVDLTGTPVSVAGEQWLEAARPELLIE